MTPLASGRCLPELGPQRVGFSPMEIHPCNLDVACHSKVSEVSVKPTPLASQEREPAVARPAVMRICLGGRVGCGGRASGSGQERIALKRGNVSPTLSPPANASSPGRWVARKHQ